MLIFQVKRKSYFILKYFCHKQSMNNRKTFFISGDRLKGSSENLLDAVNASDALAQADEEVEEND